MNDNLRPSINRFRQFVYQEMQTTYKACQKTTAEYRVYSYFGFSTAFVSQDRPN